MLELGDGMRGANVVEGEKGRCCHAKGVGNTTCALAPAIYNLGAGKMRSPSYSRSHSQVASCDNNEDKKGAF